MTLVDTGPLVAITIAKEMHHQKCVDELQTLPAGPLISTWPCLTEAMHLIGRKAGHPGQAMLWRMRQNAGLLLHNLSPLEADRIMLLMNQYRNIPMDLADASLVAAAEALGVRSIFTLDSDFYIYRLSDGSALQVIP